MKIRSLFRSYWGWWFLMPLVAVLLLLGLLLIFTESSVLAPFQYFLF